MIEIQQLMDCDQVLVFEKEVIDDVIKYNTWYIACGNQRCYSVCWNVKNFCKLIGKHLVIAHPIKRLCVNLKRLT
jgi:hypothetical protein